MDLNYMFLRQQVERSMAARAPNEAARHVHEALARQYELEIERQTGRQIFFAVDSAAPAVTELPTLSASS